MTETVELAGYFAFFWLFLFNRRFRDARLSQWREGGRIERGFILVEAATSTLIGVVVPAVLLCMMFAA